LNYETDTDESFIFWPVADQLVDSSAGWRPEVMEGNLRRVLVIKDDPETAEQLAIACGRMGMRWIRRSMAMMAGPVAGSPSMSY
jgi:hypothetical protein